MSDTLDFTNNKTYTKHKLKVTTTIAAKDLFETDEGSDNSASDVNYVWYHDDTEDSDSE